MHAGLMQWGKRLLPIGLIILVSALTFLPYANRLGFYRDDWYMLWSANVRGADSIIELFSIDRPFMGYTYSQTYRLLGNSPFNWQLYAFALKSLGAIAVYGIMRLLWPEQRRVALAAGLLFLVYPGFLGQPNAATKTNQLLSLASVLWSIWFSGQAVRTKSTGARIVLVDSAVLLCLLNLLLYEYMIGLEALRLGVLWLVIQQTEKMGLRGMIRRLARAWWPIALGIVGFLVWRLGFFTSTRETTDQFGVVQTILTNPRSILVYLGIESVMDTLETLFFAWGVPFEQYATTEKPRELATALLVGAVIVGIALLAMWLDRRRANNTEAGKSRAAWICAAGAVALYATFIPVLLASRDVDFTGGFDKYTLHASPAAVILIAGFIFGFIQGRGRYVLLGALLFLGVTTHLLNMNHWERFWENEQATWWQLWWRAPDLQDGTILLVSLPEDGFFEDYEAWGPANLIYRPEVERVTIGAEVLNPDTATKIRAGAMGLRVMRGLEYERDYTKSLLLALPADGSCLKVVDGDGILLPMQFDPSLLPILRYSYIEQVEADANRAETPATIFGVEPEHGWCYHFQNAERLRQAGDWEGVVQLGDAALAAGLKPIDRAEWLPFLQGYLWAGDENKAAAVAEEISRDAVITKEICDALGSKAYGFGAEIQQRLAGILCNE
jgi:hypothetical protein